MRLDWLPGVLRKAGLDVYEDPGWLLRGRAFTATLQGIVWHHTATGPNWLDGHVLALLRQGRRDLAGPLSQAGLERDGTWVLVAGGRANHNGYGLWGNDAIGIEAYNNGVGEPWPKLQIESYEIGTAAICEHLGWDPMAQVKGHRETDPRRKIDPAGVDMDFARKNIAKRLAKSKPAPEPEEEEPMLIILAEGRPARLVGGGGLFVSLDDLSRWNLAVSGVKQAQLTPADYDEMRTQAMKLLGDA